MQPSPPPRNIHAAPPRPASKEDLHGITPQVRDRRKLASGAWLPLPTSWVTITLAEGKNRQVRRMTAAVGFPTLRLVRARIGRLRLGDMAPGDARPLSATELRELALQPGAGTSCNRVYNDERAVATPCVRIVR